MAQENIELVKRCIAARGEGTYRDAAGLFDPDVTVDLSVRPDGRVYHGRREALEAMRAWVERWDDYHYDAERFLDAEDRVVVFFREIGRGKGSGLTVELIGATVWTIRDGRVVHAQIFADRRQALDAVGLHEEDIQSP
jgi:ketosteroid isomerase-like protein